MMKHNAKIILALLLILSIFLILLVTGVFSQGPSLKPIKKLQEYNLQLIYPDQSNFDSKALTGEYYMVSFIASWCGHCIEEIAVINSLDKKIPVKLVGIVVSDDEKNIKDLFRYMKNPFDYIGMANQFVAYNFGNFSLPQSYIVNQDGEMLFKYSGVISKRQFEEQIIPFLEQVSVQSD